MSARYPIFQGIMGAACGFLGVFAVEVLFLMVLSGIFDSRLMPRGLGWIVLPVFGGIAGWRFGKNIGVERVVLAVVDRTENGSRYTRIWIASVTLWLLSALSFYIIFNPYGHYWSSGEWEQFWLVLFAPPAIAWIGMKLFLWANRSSAGAKE
jgi:hypothetical protein